MYRTTRQAYAQAPPPGGSGLAQLIDDIAAQLATLEALRAALLDADVDDALEHCREAIGRAAGFRARVHEWGRV